MSCNELTFRFLKYFQSLLLKKKKKEEEALQMCSSIPVNIAVFATLLCAVICVVGDWARDPAVGNKTHFNHGWSRKEQKALSDNIVTCSWQWPDNVPLGGEKTITFMLVIFLKPQQYVYRSLLSCVLHFTNANIALLCKYCKFDVR